MHNQFAKLYAQILTSTVWQEPESTRLVWITLLALKDEDGYVGASVPGLAHVARVSMEDCETALATFEAPDEHSRTKDFDGRRIEVVDGGWLVLNADKYRDKQTPKQAAVAERVRKHRERRALQAVTDSPVTPDTDTDIDTDVNTKIDTEAKTKKTTTVWSEDFESLWPNYPRRAGTNSKADARRQYLARRAEGESAETLEAGLSRYAAFIEHTGKESTERVMQAARFFGRGKHYLEDNSSPIPDLPRHTDKASRGVDALAGWYADQPQEIEDGK